VLGEFDSILIFLLFLVIFSSFLFIAGDGLTGALVIRGQRATRSV